MYCTFDLKGSKYSRQEIKDFDQSINQSTNGFDLPLEDLRRSESGLMNFFRETVAKKKKEKEEKPEGLPLHIK